MPSAIYYFDGSVAGPTDSLGYWNNDANAFDGSTATAATKTTSNTEGPLTCVGTTAPTANTKKITQVRVRAYTHTGDTDFLYIREDSTGGTILNTHSCPAADGWSTWAVVTAPSTGWTWAKVKNLAAHVGNLWEIGDEIHSIEVEVTWDEDVDIYLIDGNDLIGDTTSQWNDEANCVDGDIDTNATSVGAGTLSLTGTNAPIDGGSVITRVRARFYGNGTFAGDVGPTSTTNKYVSWTGETVSNAWSQWFELDVTANFVSPFTWPALNELRGRIGSSTSGETFSRMELEVTHFDHAASAPNIETWTQADSAGATVGTIEVPTPSGVEAGDLLILVGMSDVDNLSIFPLSTPEDSFALEVSAGSGTSDCCVQAWRKIATGLEPATLTIISSENDELVGYCFRISGAETSGLSSGAIDSSTGSNNVSATLGVNGITPSVDNCLALAFIATDGSDHIADRTQDIGNGWNLIDAVAPEGGGNDVGGYAAFKVGTTGTIQGDSFSGGANDGYATITIAIAPGAGGPTEVDADAAGTSTAAAVSGATKGTTGAAAGTSAATGASSRIVSATGTCIGTSSVSGEAAAIKGATGNGGELARDSFTDTDGVSLQNHTAENGTWVERWGSGDCEISGNKVKAGVALASGCSLDVGADTYYMRAVVEKVAGDDPMLWLNWQDNQNYVGIRFYPSTVSIRVLNGGVGANPHGAYAPDVHEKAHLVEVLRRGDHYRIWIDGVIRYDFTETAASGATNVGIFFNGSATFNSSFDELQVLRGVGGIATAQADTAKVAGAVGSAAGQSTAQAQAAYLRAATGTSAGQALVTGQSAKIAGTVGTAAGTSSADGVAETVQAATPTEGHSAGTSTAQANTAAIWQIDADSGGTSTALGQSARIVSVSGHAAGSSSASGVSGAIRGTQGQAAGTSTVLGQSDIAQILESMAAAAGLSSAAAVSAYKIAVTAQAAGTSSAQGITPSIYDQEGFRFRNDDGGEAVASWAAAQDVALSAPKGQVVRLRLVLDAEGDPTPHQVTLQYRPVGAPDTDWRDV